MTEIFVRKREARSGKREAGSGKRPKYIRRSARLIMVLMLIVRMVMTIDD